MIRELFIREIEKHGGTHGLADRLLIYGHNQYISWLTYKFCISDNDTPVSALLEDFAGITGLPIYVVQYTYYRVSTTAKTGVAGHSEIRNALIERYPYPSLWDELLHYAYSPVRRFAVELLLESGIAPTDVSVTLNLSQSSVYKIRKSFIARSIQQKGDNPYGPEHH